MEAKNRFVVIKAWSVTAFVVLLAVIAWGSSFSWEASALSIYTVFPLLGLLAFSIMWAHYAASIARQIFGVEKSVLHFYVESTSLIVLGLILLHPGLISWELWREGYGLPPMSELKFVAESLKGAVVLGVIALILFLAYELRRWYADRKWFRAVEIGTDAAMIMIFFHGLGLGSHLQSGWYRTVWLAYGISLAGFLIYIYAKKLRK